MTFNADKKTANRALEITVFLDKHGWAEAELHGLDADFSLRRYARLIKTDGATAILMDAQPDQKTVEFVAIAKLLRSLKINAPEIYAEHAIKGLVLMQDMGGATLGSLMDAGKAPKQPYHIGMDILGTVHKNFSASMIAPPFPTLPVFNATLFTEQVCWFIDDYVPSVREKEVTEKERADFCAAWMKVLRPLDDLPQSLLLRDFMPDNIIIAADGTPGVLDFELSGIGPIAYDIASFCEELRRDGGLNAMPAMIDYYYEKYKPACTKQDLQKACTIFAAQRAARFLGNVMRQIKMGREEKRAMLPRVKNTLKQLLKEDALEPVRVCIAKLDRAL